MNRDKVTNDEPLVERPTLVGHGFDIIGVSSKEMGCCLKKKRSKSLNKPNLSWAIHIGYGFRALRLKPRNRVPLYTR